MSLIESEVSFRFAIALATFNGSSSGEVENIVVIVSAAFEILVTASPKFVFTSALGDSKLSKFDTIFEPCSPRTASIGLFFAI